MRKNTSNSRRVLATVMTLALAGAMLPVAPADASSKPSIPSKASVEVGKTKKLSIKTNGYKIKSVKVKVDKSSIATASASKSTIKVKGVKSGKTELTATIKAKKKDKTKSFKLTCKVTVTKALTKDSKPATDITTQKNKDWLSRLDFSDKSEEECAKKGLLKAPDALVIKDAEGNVVWDVASYSFINKYKDEKDLPGSINPSLYRNTLYNAYAGLFEVVEGKIYQVRGYDMSNATFIRTDNGWIVFDVLMCKQDMAEAKALMESYAKEKLGLSSLVIKGVLYSHSHVDHYGGIYGLVDQSTTKDTIAKYSDDWASQAKQSKDGKIVVLAPEGFLEHVISENVYAGAAMGRRAQYQYGTWLQPGEQGKLAMGIGLGQSVGNTGLLNPSYDVKTDETLTIDGLEIQFQLTPGTEAPAEMNAYFPQYKALWMAENCTGTMHNLYTLRGAEVRNADDWAKYILEAKQKFGAKTEVVFQSHNWPHWGTEKIGEYMENTAAAYQYIHDQTLHYINQGYTANEISNMLEFPEKLDKVWYTRQYYGTLSHNIRAVYQKYMGWYDANPVDLNPLTPEAEAKKWVEYLGDTDKVLEKAQADFDKGEYQWVAKVTNEIVYADPSNTKARLLCADALEQLGYQSESGTWRNCYLTGAAELRLGNQAVGKHKAGGSTDVRAQMTPKMMMDYVAIATDSMAASAEDISFNLIASDSGEKFYIKRKAGTYLIYKNETRDDANATITATNQQIMYGFMYAQKEYTDKMTVSGDTSVVEKITKYVNPVVNQEFNIVEP